MKPTKRWIKVCLGLMTGSLVLLVVGPSVQAINEPRGCQTNTITSGPVNATVCLGSSASFLVMASGPQPLYYQWQKNGVNLTDIGSVSGSSTPTLTLTGLGAADNNTSYRVMVWSMCLGVMSSTISETATLTVNTATSPTASMSGPSEVCNGTITTYTNTGGNFWGSIWVVYGQGTILGSDSGQTVSVQAGTSGSYTLALVVWAGTCFNSVSKEVTIVPAWAAIYGPSAVCAGTQNIYDGPEDPDLGYSWSISGNGTIIGATNDQSIFVQASESGTYTLSLTVSQDGICGNTASFSASIYNPTAITAQPVSMQACSWGSASFSVAATGDSLTYQWQANGQNLVNDSNILGANSATLTIVDDLWDARDNYFSTIWNNPVPANNANGVLFGSVNAGQVYQYSASGCVGYGSSGNVSDANGNVYPGSCSNPFLKKTRADNSSFVCQGLTAYSLVGKIGSTCIQLGSSGSFVAPVGGQLQVYYNSDNFPSGSGSFSVTVSSEDMDDTYDVVVSGSCGTVTSVPVTLTAVWGPEATVSGTATICPGQSTDVRAYLTGTPPWNICWSDGYCATVFASPTTHTVSPPTTTTYSISGSDATGCGIIPDNEPVVTVRGGEPPAAPSFSAIPGQYLTPLTVNINGGEDLAAFVTTNGLQPNADDPQLTTLIVSNTTLLRARAFYPAGGCASTVASGVYQIGPILSTAASFGSETSFLSTTNGTLWAWGSDFNGEQLQVPYMDFTYLDVWEGYDWVGVPNPAVGVSNPRLVSQGPQSTYVLDTSSNLWLWGFDDNGDYFETPTPVTAISHVVSVVTAYASFSSGYCYTLALKSDGTVWEVLSTNQVVQISGLTNIIALAEDPDGAAIIALRADGTVWVWGYDTSGQFGDGQSSGSFSGTPVRVPGIPSIMAISYTESHILALSWDGTVWSWGDDSEGELGTGDCYVNYDSCNPQGNPQIPMQVPGLTNVIQVAAGNTLSVALTASGQVYTWGYNGVGYYGLVGALGTGNTVSNYVSLPQLVSSLSSIQSISCAGYHTLAVMGYRGINIYWGWGNNWNGELGDGTSTNRPSPVLIHFPFDTDGDGVPDWEKYQLGWDPLNPYMNGDELVNGINQNIGFNPLNLDLNSDNYLNAYDIQSGINPFDPSTFPDQNPTNTFPVINLLEPVNAVPVE